MNQKKILIIVVGAIVLIGGVFLVISLVLKNQSTSTTTTNAERRLFYETLANAAKQQQLRLAMYRATYANKADADAKQNVGSETSSVAELDAIQAKARSVFATSLLQFPEFDIGRCIDGATYRDNYNSAQKPRPTTLQAAAADLQAGNTFLVTEAVVFSPCPKIGIVAGGSPDTALFRVSDGVFPVTLHDAEAETWRTAMQKADLFTITDEGPVERDGRTLRKISFTPKQTTGVNARLYSIFAETVNIDKIKSENPDAAYRHAFITVNPANTGSVGGFYLIDESAKLPVYSELYGTNPDKQPGSTPAASRNIARTKQTYIFGRPPDLTLQSPLELLP